MTENNSKSGRLKSVVFAVLCLSLAGGGMWFLMGQQSGQQAGQQIGASSTTAATDNNPITGSLSAPDKSSQTLGPSGLPLPRFVSLKADKANVRKGPTSEHPLAWVFQRKGLPVEIVAEFENWRRIRDSNGDEGWILQNMLASKRFAVVAPWSKDKLIPLKSTTDASAVTIANLSSGVMGQIESCDGQWCKLVVTDYKGYVQQDMLWGAYPGEKLD